MNCLFWHIAGPLEVDESLGWCYCNLLLSCRCARPACCILIAPCMSDLLCKPCWCGLVSLRHSKWKVNVCVSLSCDPVCIDVSLKVALPAASLCSAVTVLQYPVALKTLYLFRTHHVQDRQMVTTSTAKRRSIIACVYWEIYQVKGRGLVVVCMIFPVYI